MISELGGGDEGARGRREGEKNASSLRVHLDAAVSRTNLPDHRAVIGERVRIALGAELVQQRCRGEEERDGAGRKFGPHDEIIRR